MQKWYSDIKTWFVVVQSRNLFFLGGGGGGGGEAGAFGGEASPTG